jgi:hypothetical protein
MSKNLTLIAALAIAGCGSGDNDPGPGGVTVGEARALDEAAEMIEQRRPPPEALQPTQPRPEASQPDGAAP